MTIKLHIGAHKTATTHIQNLLENSREELIRNHITLSLPEELRSVWLPCLKNHANGDLLKTNCIKSIAPHNGVWILSEENISGSSYDFKVSDGMYPKLKERLLSIQNIFPDATIDIYFAIRSYETFYRSAYLEIIKNRGYFPFSEFYNKERFFNNSWVDVVEVLTNFFPQEHITLWRYEDFQELQPKILKSMTTLNNIDTILSSYKTQRTRPSLSKTAVDTLHTLYFLEGQNTNKDIVKKINETYPQSGINKEYLPFNDEDCNILNTKYKKDSDLIRSRYPLINFLETHSH